MNKCKEIQRKNLGAFSATEICDLEGNGGGRNTFRPSIHMIYVPFPLIAVVAQMMKTKPLIPHWRCIRVGDRGRDVALKERLQRLDS